jgi:hypothetical protein
VTVPLNAPVVEDWAQALEDQTNKTAIVRAPKTDDAQGLEVIVALQILVGRISATTALTSREPRDFHTRGGTSIAPRTDSICGFECQGMAVTFSCQAGLLN